MIAGLGLSGCSPAGPNSSSTRFDRVLILPQARRQQAVSLAGTTLEGTRLDVVTLRGRIVVLNIWGSWCAPCRKEAPVLENAYRDLQPQGVSFVGIDVRDDAAQALAFQKQFKFTYPSLVDDGRLLLALRGAASASTVPTTLVLDRAGRVAARITGVVDTATLVSMVGDISREPIREGS